jgi:putative ABC transport system permease protein
VEGALAADGLIQAPRRTSGTVAALMLSLALVISLGGLARASYNSISEWMRVALNLDLLITTAENLTSRGFVLPASLADELRSVEGVAEVQMVRSVRVLVKDTPVLLLAADDGALRRMSKLAPVEGRREEMQRLALAGTGVIASENFTLLHGGRLGETIDIPSPSGTLRLPIVGVVRDFSDQQGSIFLSRAVYVRNWNDEGISSFGIYLRPGAAEAVVRQRILDLYGARQRLFVLTNRDVRSYITRLTDQWFGLTYVQIAVAVLVAILGIVNALTVSIADRRRELGVLRAVGGLRWQIRHIIWMEAAAIGFIGLVLGLGLGALQLYYSVEVAQRDVVGIDLGYAYPFRMALALIPVILGASWLAALGPAERAVRGSLVEALEYE